MKVAQKSESQEKIALYRINPNLETVQLEKERI